MLPLAPRERRCATSPLGAFDSSGICAELFRDLRDLLRCVVGREHRRLRGEIECRRAFGRVVLYDELFTGLRMRAAEDGAELEIVVGGEPVQPEMLAALDVRPAFGDLLGRNPR